jgi:hypothetical protein
VAGILVAVGYEETTIARVQDLVRKRGLGTDADVQVLEDALCLVFVETQLHNPAYRDFLHSQETCPNSGRVPPARNQ